MRVLVTGTGNSGSWAIRGKQLGAAIGARVVPRATFNDIADCDVVIAVKRCPDEVFAVAHRLDKFVVWDPVDFWPQDQTSRLSQAQAIKLLKTAIRDRAPHAVVFATRQMQHDAEFIGHSLALPHHAHPEIRPLPLRERVAVVGYHGGPYLGHWEAELQAVCARFGWAFNPHLQNIAEADIAVALRGGVHAGYCATAWKSNVKLANMQAAGVPCIIEPSAGYIETAGGGEIWATNPASLLHKLASLAPLDTREGFRDRLLAKAPDVSLAHLAGVYARWLAAVAA